MRYRTLDGFAADSHGKFRGDRASFAVTVATVEKLGAAGLCNACCAHRTRWRRTRSTPGCAHSPAAYVPSRDASLDKTKRKKTWIQRFQHALDSTAGDTPLLLLGDLNVLEPTHKPAHRGQFAPFEYGFYTGLTDRHGLVDLFRHMHPDRVEHSWARRADLGYRYDHAHGSRVLAERLTSCEYVHETRQADPDGSRLTDYSGLAVRVALRATTPLLTSNPATAVTHAEPEPTLF